MSTKAGALHWNRRHLVLTPDQVLDVDTGLQQVNQNWGANSDNEPPLGIAGVAPPPGGATPASRVQVMPMAPTIPWQAIVHSEPWLNTATGTVFVTFTNTSEGQQEFNVLFWDPHTSIGPGQAQTYNPAV